MDIFILILSDFHIFNSTNVDISSKSSLSGHAFSDIAGDLFDIDHFQLKNNY